MTINAKHILQKKNYIKIIETKLKQKKRNKKEKKEIIIFNISKNTKHKNYTPTHVTYFHNILPFFCTA